MEPFAGKVMTDVGGVVSAPRLYPMVTSWSPGVCAVSVVESAALYWRYREETPIAEPLPTAWKVVQEPSGGAMLPVRTDRTAAVPVGRAFVQENVPQFTLWPASNTRERKVPEVA